MIKKIETKLKDTYFKWLLGLSALSILLISAYFSIRGISQLFSGQRVTAMILAGSLEFAKIVVTTYLTRHWFDTNKIMRTYFLAATIVLILISSAGIFANLTDAYQVTVLKTQVMDIESNSLDAEELSLKERKTDLQYEIKTIGEEIELIRGSIQRNDTQVQNLYYQMEEDSTANWVGSIWEFKDQNNNYKKEITNLRDNKDKARLEIVKIDSLLKNVWINTADMKSSDKINNIGPLKKLSELFNVEMDVVAKNFIFVIIAVFDPLGVLLVVAFNLMIIKKVTTTIKPKKKEITILKEPENKGSLLDTKQETLKKEVKQDAKPKDKKEIKQKKKPKNKKETKQKEKPKDKKVVEQKKKSRTRQKPPNRYVNMR